MLVRMDFEVLSAVHAGLVFLGYPALFWLIFLDFKASGASDMDHT